MSKPSTSIILNLKPHTFTLRNSYGAQLEELDMTTLVCRKELKPFPSIVDPAISSMIYKIIDPDKLQLADDKIR